MIETIEPGPCDVGPLSDITAAIEAGDVVAYGIVTLRRGGEASTAWSIAGSRNDLVAYALLGALSALGRRLLRHVSGDGGL